MKLLLLFLLFGTAYAGCGQGNTNFPTPVESVKKRPFFPLISIYLCETYNFLQKSIYCENEYG